MTAQETSLPGGVSAGSPAPSEETPAPSQRAPTATPWPPSPTPTEWHYPTPGPDIGTPFSGPQRYIIHHVAPGESLAVLVQRYQTTEAVLAVANARQAGQGLLAGELLVVPVDQSDPAGLPAFEILYLTQNHSLAALAGEYATTERALRQYNALGPGDLVPIGRWLIVPLPGE